jgi:hypothetical protein
VEIDNENQVFLNYMRKKKDSDEKMTRAPKMTFVFKARASTIFSVSCTSDPNVFVRFPARRAGLVPNPFNLIKTFLVERCDVCTQLRVTRRSNFPLSLRARAAGR